MDRWPPIQWKEEDYLHIKSIEKWVGFLNTVEYEHRYSLNPKHKLMCEMIKEDIDYLLKERLEIEQFWRSHEPQKKSEESKSVGKHNESHGSK